MPLRKQLHPPTHAAPHPRTQRVVQRSPSRRVLGVHARPRLQHPPQHRAVLAAALRIRHRARLVGLQGQLHGKQSATACCRLNCNSAPCGLLHVTGTKGPAIAQRQTVRVPPLRNSPCRTPRATRHAFTIAGHTGTGFKSSRLCILHPRFWDAAVLCSATQSASWYHAAAATACTPPPSPCRVPLACLPTPQPTPLALVPHHLTTHRCTPPTHRCAHAPYALRSRHDDDDQRQAGLHGAQQQVARLEVLHEHAAAGAGAHAAQAEQRQS